MEIFYERADVTKYFFFERKEKNEKQGVDIDRHRDREQERQISIRKTTIAHVHKSDCTQIYIHLAYRINGPGLISSKMV